MMQVVVEFYQGWFLYIHAKLDVSQSKAAKHLIIICYGHNWIENNQ